MTEHAVGTYSHHVKPWDIALAAREYALAFRDGYSHPSEYYPRRAAESLREELEGP